MRFCMFLFLSSQWRHDVVLVFLGQALSHRVCGEWWRNSFLDTRLREEIHSFMWISQFITDSFREFGSFEAWEQEALEARGKAQGRDMFKCLVFVDVGLALRRLQLRPFLKESWTRFSWDNFKLIRPGMWIYLWGLMCLVEEGQKWEQWEHTEMWTLKHVKKSSDGICKLFQSPSRPSLNLPPLAFSGTLPHTEGAVPWSYNHQREIWKVRALGTAGSVATVPAKETVPTHSFRIILFKIRSYLYDVEHAYGKKGHLQGWAKRGVQER